jgi:hypothetical protein
MLRTFSHEFTHFLEKYNAVWYNDFRKVVFETLANKHKNIFEKIHDMLREFLADLKAYFKTIGHNPSREANALKEQVGEAVHYVESIVQLFDKVAVEAVDNYQKTVATDKTTKNSENIEKTSHSQEKKEVTEYAEQRTENKERSEKIHSGGNRKDESNPRRTSTEERDGSGVPGNVGETGRGLQQNRSDERYLHDEVDFLFDRKDVFADTFSEDVYEQLGAKREDSKFSKNLLYQELGEGNFSNRSLRAVIASRIDRGGIVRRFADRADLVVFDQMLVSRERDPLQRDVGYALHGQNALRQQRKHNIRFFERHGRIPIEKTRLSVEIPFPRRIQFLEDVVEIIRRTRLYPVKRHHLRLHLAGLPVDTDDGRGHIRPIPHGIAERPDIVQGPPRCRALSQELFATRGVSRGNLKAHRRRRCIWANSREKNFKIRIEFFTGRCYTV